MAAIGLKEISHNYVLAEGAEVPAVRGLDLEWEDGQPYALLGPSGCGKTTLLNLISGLLTPTRGSVLFDAINVTAMGPAQRNIAQVFQFPVVYGSLTVAENLAFPLRNRRVPQSQIRKRVEVVAELLELQGHLKTRSNLLSTGQKQLLSLGRGLVREDTAAVLFDEPLTLMDPEAKWQLRRKLRIVQRELKLTMIYVTHDQLEALTFAERVVIMQDGRILQNGTPEDLFERPAHRFVGHFIGSPGMNFLPADAADAPGYVLRAGQVRGVQVGVRPEHFYQDSVGSAQTLRGTVRTIVDLGNEALVEVQVNTQTITARLAAGDLPGPGEPISLAVRSGCLHWFDEHGWNVGSE